MRFVQRLPLLWCCSWVACGDDMYTQTRHYQDEGSICLSPRASGGAHVQVVLRECASSCARIEASCSVSVEASVLRVVAEGTTKETWDRGNPRSCPDVCMLVAAGCQLPPLPEGTYELSYGERAVNVSVPVISRTGLFQETGTSDVCSLFAPLP